MSVRVVQVLAVLAFGAAPFMAQAADQPDVAPFDAAAIPAGHDWSGVYVGVNAGYAWGEFDSFAPAVISGDPQFGGRGALGGFQIGYNKQLGSVVIGLEGDVQAAAVEGDTSYPGTGTDVSLDWFSTVRGRVGYAFDRTLVYGTGGVAIAGFDVETATDAGSDTAVGFTAGAGVEQALSENLTLKAEYLYLGLDEKEVDTGANNTTVQWDGHVMRFGANLKF